MTGRLAIVGLGPGGPEHRTRAAERAVTEAEVVAGYRPYLEQCADLTGAHQRLLAGAIGEESERAAAAVHAAADGASVALVSSGDPGVYGMASRALRAAAALPRQQRPQVRVVPGVTAATAAAALLGAPLARDFTCLTLSDLLVPWEQVEARLQAVAATDLVVVLYNPRSSGRPWQLARACEVLLGHRAGETPVGLVTDAGRDGEQVVLATLADLDISAIGMRSTVVVGGSGTARLGDWLVTGREVSG